MTGPLTPDQRRRAERLITRASKTGRASAVATFLLLLAAIWLTDWRFAATAVLMLPVAAGTLALAGRLRRALAEEEGR